MANGNKAVRVTLTLPQQTLKAADQFRKKQNFDSRSALIDQALRSFMSSFHQKQFREELRKELVRGYQSRAVRDLALTKEWEAVDAALPEDDIEKDYE